MKTVQEKIHRKLNCNNYPQKKPYLSLSTYISRHVMLNINNLNKKAKIPDQTGS